MCAQKKAEPQPPEEPTPAEPPKGKPEPNPLTELVSKLSARVSDLERFIKETEKKVVKAPLLGRIAQVMGDPDEWRPAFLREPKSPR